MCVFRVRQTVAQAWILCRLRGGWWDITMRICCNNHIQQTTIGSAHGDIPYMCTLYTNLSNIVMLSMYITHIKSILCLCPMYCTKHFYI